MIRTTMRGLLAGVCLGSAMGGMHDFSLRSVHAHINLLGWASMLGIGLLMRLLGDKLSARLAWVQFWLHQLALPVIVVALVSVVRGNPALEPVLAIMSIVVVLSVLVMVFNLWVHLKVDA